MNIYLTPLIRDAVGILEYAHKPAPIIMVSGVTYGTKKADFIKASDKARDLGFFEVVDPHHEAVLRRSDGTLWTLVEAPTGFWPDESQFEREMRQESEWDAYQAALEADNEAMYDAACEDATAYAGEDW